MLKNFLAALGLVFVIEGILPFAMPQKWRKMMILLLSQNIVALRRFGLTLMLIGLFITSCVHHFM